MAASEARSTRAGDAWGGLASMLVAYPQALAYGVAIWAVLGSTAHGVLYATVGTVVLGIGAALVGGSPRLISSPCGPAYILLLALAQELLRPGEEGRMALEPGRVAAVLAVVALLSGGLQVLLGALRAGKLIKFIPFSVVSGYLSGVGILILVDQVPTLLGVPKGTGLWVGLGAPATWEGPALAVGLATIAGMVLAPRLTKRVPAVVVGLVGGLLVYGACAAAVPALRALDGNALVVGPLGSGGVGEIAGGVAGVWKSLATLQPGDLLFAVAPALTLAVLLSIDTLKTCVVVDTMTRSRSDSNRVLLAQGTGNLLSALCGGMPGAGTMGGTLVNFSSGGRTRLSGVLAGVLALGAFLVFEGLIAWVPRAALAGILAVVAFRMIDRRSLDLLKHRSTRLDFAVVATVVLTAVLLGPLPASGVGLTLSILLFIREQIHVSVVRRRATGEEVSSKRDRLPEAQAVLRERGRETVVCELQGTLFFGTTDQLLTILDQDLRTCRYLVLDLRRVQSVDYTAAHILEQIEATLAERGATLLFTHFPETLPSGRDLKAYLDTMGLVKEGRNVQVFDSMHEALEWVEDRILAEAGLGRAGGEPPLSLEEFELFRELKPNSQRLLREAVVERSVPAGDALFRRWGGGTELYLIRSGTVHIRLPLDGGRYKHLVTFSRGSFFGDVTFLERSQHFADAVAVEDSELYLLSRERVDELSHAHPRTGAMFFARLARSLAQRLRRTDAALRSIEEA